MTKQSTNMSTALLLLSVFSLKGQVQEGTTSQHNTMYVIILELTASHTN